jgi:hypothetical protein
MARFGLEGWVWVMAADKPFARVILFILYDCQRE